MKTEVLTIELSEEVRKRVQRIKVLLMDVDGVLTDGKLFYLPNAEGKPVEFKGFNSQDGLGFHFLNSEGIKTGVISGRESPATTERARILKMSYVYQGLLEKDGAYEEVLAKEDVTQDEVAFIGDDFTDVPLLVRSGLACAPQDARPEVKAKAHIVTRANGGQGAVREVIEIILKVQERWPRILSKFKLD